MLGGERGKQCETENNKIEEKNSVFKCVGERQRHIETERERALVYGHFVFSVHGSDPQ